MLAAVGCLPWLSLRGDSAPQPASAAGAPPLCVAGRSELAEARLNYFASGGFYLGAWEGLSPAGAGLRGYCNGDLLAAQYEGQFKGGVLDGQGVLRWSDGASLSAIWINGLPVRDIQVQSGGHFYRFEEATWMPTADAEVFRASLRTPSGSLNAEFRSGALSGVPRWQAPIESGAR